MRPMQWLGFELKRLLRNRFASLAAVVIILIPLLYSFLYLYAFWDPYDQLEELKVAVVNHDSAVTEKGQTVNAGEDLVSELKDDHSVGWVFTNEQDAFYGLNRSKYDLVIIIPYDFSRKILDTTKDPENTSKSVQDFSQSTQGDPNDIQTNRQEPSKAKLLYYSNPSKNYLAEQIGNKVASNLEGDLNGQIAADFLDNVFGNLNDMKGDLQSAVDGSSELQDGIAKAFSGSKELTDHLGDALDGSHSLSDGLLSIADGSKELAQGNADLADGSSMLLDGAQTIQNGVDDALDGSVKLSEGAHDLVKGLNDANDSLLDAAIGSAKLSTGLDSAYDGSKDLRDGLANASAGSSQLKDGTTQLEAGLKRMKAALNSTDPDPKKAGVPVLLQGVAQIVGTTSEPAYTPDNPQTITNGVKVSGDGIGQVKDGLNSAIPSLTNANTALQDAKSKLDQVLSRNPVLQEDVNFMTAYQEVMDVQQGLQNQAPALMGAVSGLDQIQQGLTGHSSNPQRPTVIDGLRSLNGGAVQLHEGLQALLSASNTALDQLISGASELAKGTQDLEVGLVSAHEGSDTLTEGLHDLKDGSEELTSGLATGASDFSLLVDGGNSLQDGIEQLTQGLKDLSGGMITFVDKLGELVQGAVKLEEGSKTLNEGAIEAVDGSNSLQDGLAQLHDGSMVLTDGLDKAETGSADLTSGLKDGVNQLEQDLPRNTAIVSKAMGQPVEVDETQVHPVDNYGTGFAPYFVPLSLWVGALMLFFLINLKENSLRAAGVSKVKVLMGKYATLAFFGTTQAVISSFVLITFLGLRPAHILQFYGFNILQSLTYVAIIFLFVELFDMAGRFIAIVLLMLQLTSGGGTYPISLIPKFFQILHPYLPMTYGISALRQIISGSADIPLHTSIIVLAGFGFGALLLVMLLSPKRLRIKDLHPSQQLGA